ncbi:MAG: riboflavin synthase [Candidatus Methylomirabilales bacterium]
MFTGIVQEQGSVVALTRGEGEGARLTVHGGTLIVDLAVGHSIAVNGVCLTVILREGTTFTTDLSPETLTRTTLGDLKPQERVNLEVPLKLGDYLGGHFVTGHVDAVGRVSQCESLGESRRMWIAFPPSLSGYIATKGSITLDGVSLTIADVSQESFSVCLIPHTLAVTTLGVKRPGSLTNIEVDLLSRYLERLLATEKVRDRPPLRPEQLLEQGFA